MPLEKLKDGILGAFKAGRECREFQNTLGRCTLKPKAKYSSLASTRKKEKNHETVAKPPFQLALLCRSENEGPLKFQLKKAFFFLFFLSFFF